MTSERVGAELVAVIAAVADGSPVVLTTDAARDRLPAGPLRSDHRSMQAGLSAWVEQQTGHRLGYVEQLYTFADPDRSGAAGRVISVSYLGLTTVTAPGAEWRGWYDLFPWEDRRHLLVGHGTVTPDAGAPVLHALLEWARAADGAERDRRTLRCTVCFGLDGGTWRPELALQRYELLYEAGLLPESGRVQALPGSGEPMALDHRRILATGVARLRAKIQYHPVVFELMPETFTLGRLQATVEALAGQPLHKQNFRRLVMHQDLVEETGETDADTGGRPARLYRFRRPILDERHVAGTKLPEPRTR